MAITQSISKILSFDVVVVAEHHLRHKLILELSLKAVALFFGVNAARLLAK